MLGEKKINDEGFPIDLEFGKFTYVRCLDSGGAGIVALYRTNPPKNDEKSPYPDLVAVKFDPSTETTNLTETLWLKGITERIKNENLSIRMPKYYLHSFFNGRRFFVMDYLPDSIDDLLKQNIEEMKDKELAVADIALKMLIVV